MCYDSDDFPYEKDDALSEEREEVENTLAEELSWSDWAPGLSLIRFS